MLVCGNSPPPDTREAGPPGGRARHPQYRLHFIRNKCLQICFFLSCNVVHFFVRFSSVYLAAFLHISFVYQNNLHNYIRLNYITRMTQCARLSRCCNYITLLLRQL